ncbi:MAG: hypothetical protein ACOC46_00460, partial [Pirellulales bacterium]
MTRAVFRSILLGMVLLAAEAANSLGDGPAGPLAEVEKQLQRIAGLDRAEQQRTLHRLERRLTHAASQILPAARAQQFQARLRRELRREVLSWDDLRSMLGRLDRLESALVDRLARQYRIQTYRSFGRHRPRYDRRQQAWQEVHAAWRASDSPLWRRDRLIAWLEQAIRRSRPGLVAALPAAPSSDGREPPPTLTGLARSEPAEPDLRRRQPEPRPVALPEPQLTTPAQRRHAGRNAAPQIARHPQPELRREPSRTRLPPWPRPAAAAARSDPPPALPTPAVGVVKTAGQAPPLNGPAGAQRAGQA